MAPGSAKERSAGADKQAVTGPSFRFRLERVRAVRERRERLAQQELAQSISRLASSEAELRSADSSVEQARAEQRDAVAAPRMLGGTELLARQAFLERVEAERRVRELELERSEAEVDERSATLTTAATEHQMLERLRERRRGEHDREVARVEGNLLDEIATARHARRSA
jgi:flagellar FliJ protein